MSIAETLQKSHKSASKHAIKGSLYPEFDYLYLQESKRRKAAIQKEKEQLELTIRRTTDHWDAVPPIADFGGADHSDDDFDDNGAPHHHNHSGGEGDDPFQGYDDGPYSAGGGSDHDELPQHHQMPGGPPTAGDDDNFVPPMALDDGDADHAVVETYEDMCRHQIETYLAQAQKYDQHLETSLSKRVREWEDKIKPLLNEQDSRPYFNVRQTGQEVLDRFQEKGVKQKGALSLQEVAGSDAQVYEVIRVFMASLHLANSGNLDIKTKGKDMNLVLKSAQLHELEA
jgi:hypothetical protein